MTPMFKPTTLALALVSAVALSGCPKQELPTSRPRTPASPRDAGPRQAHARRKQAAAAPTASRSADLDASKNACADFGGYVNGKWLAANPIPGDRPSWGAFDMLAERSLAVQHQLAEQAAADTQATGVEKIVGDFCATGMDEAKVDAQGIDAAAEPPGRDRRADRQPARSPTTCATAAAKGEGYPVRIRPRSRLQGFDR